MVRALKDLGVQEIQACCIHGVLCGNAANNINDSALSQLVVTDTVCMPEEKKVPKLKVISVAELFAKAILHTNKGQSISGLYDRY